jgi:peptide/nickel transport system permease protein
LGGIFISEAHVGFLGVGIKFPLACWGCLINSASVAFVMTYFWFMWIPAGLLILLTVLGFNFVGDGLRDAYDPKMKR